MKIKLKRIRQLGYLDGKYKQWRQTEAERKRPDIDPKKLYIVRYEGIWLFGRFYMQWYGWSFHPNYGANTLQLDNLEDQIYEVVKGFDQEKSGDTAHFIMDYLAEEMENDEDED